MYVCIFCLLLCCVFEVSEYDHLSSADLKRGNALIRLAQVDLRQLIWETLSGWKGIGGWMVEDLSYRYLLGEHCHFDSP